MGDGIDALRALAHIQVAEASADAQRAEDVAEQQAKPEPADATEREGLVRTPRERERQDFYDKPAADESVERDNQAEQFASSVEKQDAATKESIISNIGREAPEPKPDLDFGSGAATEALPYIEQENVHEPMDQEPEFGVLDGISNTVELTAESPTVDGFSPTVDGLIDSIEDTQSTTQFDIDG